MRFQWAQVINTALNRHFPDLSVRVISEPGRFYVGAAYTLACNVYSVRDVIGEDGSTAHRMYYINDGVFGSFNGVITYNEDIFPLLLNERRGVKSYSSSIWGPTCDCVDVLTENMYLPAMQVGDWLVFENMGAYTLSCATSFNGFVVPSVYNVVEKKVWDVLKDLKPITTRFVLGKALLK